MRKLIFLCFLFIFGLSTANALNSSIKVRIFTLQKLNALMVSSRVAWKIQVAGSNQIFKIPPDRKVKISVRENQLSVLGPPSFRASRITLQSSSGDFLKLETPVAEAHYYVGEVRVAIQSGRLRLVQKLPFESYILGVLSHEMPEDFPLEAQKAQAVAIRSYTLAQGSRHAKESFQFCDTTHCQNYGGQRASPIFLTAHRQTQGNILTYQDQPIHAYYHSTCGGHTSEGHKVFGGSKLPYLRRVEDESFCRSSPHANWETTLSAKDLRALFDAEESLEGSASLQLFEGEINGRIFELGLKNHPDKNLSAQKFLSRAGRLWGWGRIKSAWFEALPNGNGYQLNGKGLGHGVGLCQWGARGMAQKGMSYQEILQHYFPQARLEKSYE